MRKVYAIEFSSVIDISKLIVNIDEKYVFKVEKNQLLLHQKVIKKIWNNPRFNKSLLLILYITNQGDWYASNLTSLNRYVCRLHSGTKEIVLNRFEERKKLRSLLFLITVCS